MNIKVSQHHSIKKSVILGTAMWAWTIDNVQCFQLLDEFYAAGFRQVDTATNYPINKDPDNFRAAEDILLEWIKAHEVTDLEIIQKVGSINNLHTPEHNLSKSFLLLNLDDYRHRYGSNLHTFMIHWDNRQDKDAIGSSFEALQTATEYGLHPGLSGIKYPELYAEINREFQLDFRIEIKHNFQQSDYPRYKVFHQQAEFLAYGLNAGGMKLNPKQYTQRSGLMARGGPPTTDSFPKHLLDKLPALNEAALPIPLTSFNQIGMINAYYHPGISHLIIGPSSVFQLKDTLEFYRHLQTNAYQEIYQALQSLRD
ncbi:MAG: aldo/keto reductase [Saprospiraceae bacterium]